MTKEIQDSRQKENMSQIEELMRQRKQGYTLKQKIERYLEKVKKKDIVRHLTESFYAPAIDRGVAFMLRRTNLQRDDGRTLNIIDEIEVQAAQEQADREAEAAKDMTFEDFKEQFLAHIEGTAPNEREAIESADENAGDAMNKSQKKDALSKNELIKTISSQRVDESGSVEGKRSQRSKLSNKRSTMDAKSNFSRTLDVFNNRDLPESCMLSMMKGVLVEKLADKFFLAVHPFPKIEGQMMIFKPKKGDQKKVKDIIVYRDYSLRKRVETVPKNVRENPAMKARASTIISKSTEKKDKDKKSEGQEPSLACLEVDVVEPLTKEEWRSLAHVVNETQGLGWF